MLVDEGLELLTEDEAWDLLRTGSVGRIGVSVGALPAIFPVNYSIVDGDIVFRTSPGTKLTAAATDAIVAFEVDQFDGVRRSGWSVLVVGRSEIVEDASLSEKVLAALAPFAQGRERVWVVRVRPEFISGRRIVRDAAAAAS